jgi:tripartite-type tricarboxylate transporter receptor subunit TctC
LPTNGGGPALTSFLGNNAQVLVSSISAAINQIKAGKARPLAQFGDKRAASLPDVPTMRELGYDLEYYLWVGMFAPKGTPEAITTKLRQVLNQAAHSDLFKTAVANLGQELGYQDQPEFAKFWDAAAARIEAAVHAIGRVQG